LGNTSEKIYTVKLHPFDGKEVFIEIKGTLVRQYFFAAIISAAKYGLNNIKYLLLLQGVCNKRIKRILN
jgi:hypothetical protein